MIVVNPHRQYRLEWHLALVSRQVGVREGFRCAKFVARPYKVPVERPWAQVPLRVEVLRDPLHWKDQVIYVYEKTYKVVEEI